MKRSEMVNETVNAKIVENFAARGCSTSATWKFLVLLDSSYKSLVTRLVETNADDRLDAGGLTNDWF